MDTSTVIDQLKPVFTRVKQQIKEHLDSDIPYVSEVAGHILFAGGKHLRPVLFVLSSQICDYPGDREYYFSSIFEYLHAATLLHDDVIDRADTRRGQKAAHIVYGNQSAILIGDFLLAKCMTIGARTGLLEFTEVMSKTVARMAEGEVLQLLNAGNPEITETDYEKVIYRKTGILIESACYLGAVLAEAPSVQAMALKTYGRKIGLAFQIMDDCLDYTTTSEEFGKPVGHDLDEGKVTLPLIRTLAAASPEDKDILTTLIVKNQRNPDEFARVLDLLGRYNGLTQAVGRASELAREAQKALDIFPDNHQKEALSSLAEYIVTRRK